MKGKVILMTLAAILAWSGAALGQSCEGICGDQSPEGCWCDSVCFGYGDCCDDICDFCANDYPAQCDVPCEPTQTCEDLSLACGVHPECDWVPDFCGACEAGFGCIEGVCIEGACEDPDDIPDCDGVCSPADWLADGYCDDGTWGANFNCEEFNWDEGDCPVPCTPTQTCEELGVACGPHPECPLDPAADCGACEAGYYCDGGACVENPCEDGDIPGCGGVCELESWLGDGWCDTNFNCAEMNWDNGDCEPCEPNCDGIECGPDPDCGVICDVCDEGFFCEAGVCLECSCDGLECGFDECGNPCGDCADGFGCVDHVCVEQTCAGACGGQGVGGCWCDANCFGYGDCCPDVCDECPDVNPDMCACVPDCDGKDCGFDGCWGDCGVCDEGSACTVDGLCEVCDCGDKQCGADECGNPCGDNEGACADGEFCDDDFLCQVCDCGDKQCGFDECGNPCGDLEGECAEGAYCYEGACYEGAGCGTSDAPGCGGCACEDCVFSIDPYCQDNEWDKLCVEECILVCGGCGDQAGCGDGACDYPENCSSCPEDCACPDGLVCGWDADLIAFDCVVGNCEDGMEVGCCDGDVLQICHEVFGFTINDCAADDNVCGWFAGDDEFDPGYYCGSADLLVDEDPDGVYPAACACIPDCTGLDCGPDPVCGEDCGSCADGFTCDAGVCVEDACVPDCTDLDCGPDPVCGEECGPCGDGFVCDAGVCVEDAPPMDTCDGNCGVYEDTALCNCDADCFEFDDCCDDVCEFCADDYPEECGACVPDCTGLDCGPDPICGEDCGACDDGFTCDAGICVEDAPDCVAVCAGHCGDFAGCACGDCEDGFECLANVCELIVIDEDIFVGPGEDIFVGPGEDIISGDGGGGGGDGCATTGTSNPVTGLLVLFALMGLAVIRRVHA